MLIDFTLTQTGVILRVKVRQDNTGAKPGQGMTGLTFSSTGIIIAAMADVEATTTAYTSAATHIQTVATLGTFAAPSASNCRFKEVDSTNHPGIYEVQLDNTRYGVSNAKYLQISLSGVTGMADCDVVIPLRAVNPYSSSFGLVLVKGTNITGLNDIPATAIVSSGAINTSSGAVSNVTLTAATTNLTNAPTSGDLTSTMKASIATTQAGLATSSALSSVASVVGSNNAVLTTLQGRIPGTVAQHSDLPSNFTALVIDSGSGGVTVHAYVSGQDPATLVLDAAAASHDTDSTIGAKINAIGGGGGSAPTVPEIVTGIFTAAISSSDFDTSDSYGALVKASRQLTLAAASASPNTATLPVGDTLNYATDNTNCQMTILSGTGAKPGFPVIITSSPGAGLQHVDRAWPNGTPDDTSVYQITAPNATPMIAGTVTDKTGYALTQAFPSNFASMTIDSGTGGVTVHTNADKAGYALSSSGLDTITIESGINARQALSPMLAAASGVITGNGTGTVICKSPTGITRITATMGTLDRTATTLALPT